MWNVNAVELVQSLTVGMELSARLMNGDFSWVTKNSIIRGMLVSTDTNQRTLKLKP